MQTELCFSVPPDDGGAFVSAKDWRSRISLASNRSLPDWFFGRDESGARLEGFPELRFLGGRRALRIVAFGEEKSQQLTALMPELFKLIGRIAGKPVPVRMNQHAVGVSLSERQYIYRVQAPMLTRRIERSKYMDEQADPATRAAYVKRRIAHGLARQAAFFGLDLPPDDEIDLIECGDFRVKKIHDGSASGVQYAVIAMPAELKGIWQTGMVLSHGHGLVTPWRRRAERDREAA